MNSLLAQLTDVQKQLVIEDVSNLIKISSLSNPQNINSEQMLNRSTVKNLIKKSIDDNNVDQAIAYFDAYASILDTLVITNPVVSREIVYNLKSAYEKVPSVHDRISYYLSLVEYNLGFYEQSEIELILLINDHPQSPLLQKSITLLLKTYLNLKKEEDAFTLLKSINGALTNDQNYLAGHICFVLEKDALAEEYFLKVSDGKYKEDSQKMLMLLSILKQEPHIAKAEFENLLQHEPSNPFILLCLARLSCLTGNWQDAEMYYSQYIPSMKIHRDLQVQFELATSFINVGDDNKAIETLDNAIKNKDLSEFISPLLYLWAELTANKGQVEPAKIRTNKIRQVVANNIELISEKTLLINRIKVLKQDIGEKPSVEQINNTIDELEIISNKLNSINIKVVEEPYGIAQHELARWTKIEKQIVFSLLDQLTYYVLADGLKDIQDTLFIKQFESLESIYKEQVRRLASIRASLLKLNESNTYLAIQNEIDNNIEVLDKIRKNLYDMKSSTDPTFTAGQIDSLIVENERKRTETKLLLDYYDYDNALYKKILDECDSSSKATSQLIKSITASKIDFLEQYPIYVSNKEKRNIIQDISNLQLLIPEYNNLLASQQASLKNLQTDLEYIDLYIDFVETKYYDRNKSDKEKSLTFEDTQKLFVANQERKKFIYSKILAFVNKNVSSGNKMELSDYPIINIMASAYFVMAELGNSIMPDQPKLILSNYKKVLEIDPKFHLTDAVLYNIGYISSLITKSNIENEILALENMQHTSMIVNRQDSLLFSEMTYKEAIAAYKRITTEFKNSQYYSEALYRLGYIFFEIGTDAERPIEYYKMAREYYDEIINTPNNPYLYKALYQRGWTWLNSSSEEAYKHSIQDFATILRAIDQNEINDETEAIDYSLASKKNIGYCLIGLDSSDYNKSSIGAEYVLNNLSKMVNKSDLTQILDETINQDLALYLPMNAIDYMNVKIRLDPLAIENPIVSDSICTLYRLYPNLTRNGISADSIYIAERENIKTKYGLESDWYNSNKDKDIAKQLQIVKQAYIDLEKRYNNSFVDIPSVANSEKYVKLIDQYSRFREIHDAQSNTWIQEKQANIIAQNIKTTQQTKNVQQYLALASRIYIYNDKYPQNDSYFSLEGTAYNCARIVVDSLKTDLTALKTLDNNVVIPLSDENPSQYYQLAAQRFMSVLENDRFRSVQNDNLYISIILRQSEIAYEQQKHDLATSYYKMVIDFDGYVTPDVKRTVYINLAEIAESTNQFKDAENWYRNAEKYALSEEDKEVLHQHTLIQIQNSIDKSNAAGNNTQMAEDYIRLANEYKLNNPVKSLQYLGEAQLAYQKAKDYSKSIALLLEISKAKTSSKEVFDFYRLAWSIADSSGNVNQSDSLKRSFMERYPSSNEAYQVRLSLIDKKISNPSTIKQAGEMYLELYNDIKTNKIDSGNDDPASVYLAAIGMFDKAGSEQEKDKLAEQFISEYPNHPSTIPLMEYLADRALARGDIVKYDQIAKTIFLKDKTRNLRYSNIAKAKLEKIATEFNRAYRDKNWQNILKYIEEFKTIHTAYKNEGLNLDFSPVYSAFDLAEKEYKEIQERIAFINQFNKQLEKTETGFLRRSPDNLLKVNEYTKWKRNLIGGDNRIGALKNATSGEIIKIRNVLASGAKYNLDVNDRLRAFDLICRVAEYSSEVINLQVNKYMTKTVEFDSYKKQFRGSEDELYSAFDTQRDGHSLSVIQQAYPYYLTMYKYFYIPGYHDKYTNKAYKSLQKFNALPRYRIEHLNIDSDWQLFVSDLYDSTIVSPYTTKNTLVKSPQGDSYNQITIPPNSEVLIKKTFDLKVPYEYAIANVITPYFNRSVIKLNDKTVDFTFNAIDKFDSKEDQSVRNALIFGEGKFSSGINNLEMHFMNPDSVPLDLKFNLMVISDSVKIDAATIIDTITVNTDQTWQYAKYSDDRLAGDWSIANKSNQFGFSNNKLFEMENTSADPIWVKTGDMQDAASLIYKKGFVVNGVLKDGIIKFIAPDIATVVLNDKVISTEYQLNYDPESDLVFAGQIILSPADIRQGLNTIKVIVKNQSEWKGMLAEIRLVVAHPE